MKHYRKTQSISLLLMVGLLFAIGCNKNGDNNLSVTTKQVTEIFSNSSKSGGKVTASGNVSVEMCGICWSETPSPTTNDYFTTDNQGAGEYISVMKNLRSNTKYYVRAYATLSSGMVMYGEEKDFTTLSEGGGGGGGNGGGNGGGTGTDTPSVIRVINCTYNSVEVSVIPTPQASYYNTQIVGEWDAVHHDASETSITIGGLSPETNYTFNFSFYDSGDNLIESQQVSATTIEQPYQSAYVTVTLVNATPTYLELRFEPSDNTAYYCYNVGGTLNSTTHQMGYITKKFTQYQNTYFQPNTEYEFSVIAYDANGIAGEVIHPKFRTNPVPYSNYYRVFDNVYQLSYAKLINQPSGNVNLRFKEIQLWSEPNYWVRFLTVVYSYETDNNWSSGTYTINTYNVNNIGDYACGIYDNNGSGSNANMIGGTFTISKNGNISTYDLYGSNGAVTAHSTGIPTE